MSSSKIRIIVILGALTIVGIFVMQAYYLKANYNKEEIEFDRSVKIALRNVAEIISKYNKVKLPDKKVIVRESSNLYQVNVNSNIDQSVLAVYLETEFDKQGLQTPFEYGIYDCASNELIYSECCFNEKKPEIKKSKKIKVKKSEATHYFEVKFPERSSFVYQEMSSVILFSGLLFLASGIFAISIFIILRQKRYSEMMKDFVNNMTHEFKTPISSIKIASDVLLHHPSIEDDARLTQYTKIIRDQNQRLNDHVEKILNIAKMESSTFVLKFEEVNFIDYLKEITDHFGVRVHEMKGELNVHFELDKAIVKIDKFHMNNVISNLLDNAIKYSQKPPHIDLSCRANKNVLELIIQDQGIGIKAQDVEKLFEKFYRVSTGDVHNVKGFGIGLYYVKRICDAHKIPVEISSEYGKGTSVKLVFQEVKF